MECHEAALPGLLLLTPEVHGDHRGFFVETARAHRYADWGIPPLVQDNHSRSSQGVLRGLHFQVRAPQGKLIRCARGRILDVCVDVRRGSDTFGQHATIELDDRAHQMLYIPPGFAHGFAVLSETADVLYRCTEYYAPSDQGGILWNDPDLAIDWRTEAPLLSDRDTQWPTLRALRADQLPRL
jgi:dTDP-4-dehydrorhamnose 3,5-epimerase